ncbi:MAG: sulfatase [Phycisphaerae bacterium]
MANQPNLLFIYTDEQRYDTLAAYGNSKIHMPNLNKLADSSTVFQKAYVTQPICTPSRSSLLTGLYPHTHTCVQNNIPLRPETPCLPEMVTKQYKTAHIGKWHLGDEIYPQHGFETWLGSEDTYHRFYSDQHDEFADRSAYHHWLKEKGVEPESNSLPEEELKANPWLRDRFFRTEIHRLPEDLCRPAFLGEATSQYIRDNKDNPFICYVNFLEPHMPFYSCRDDQYDPADVDLPENFKRLETLSVANHKLQAAMYEAKGFAGEELATEEDWRRLIARYWGMCSLVDTHVGRILDTLDECGLADNTIIVFTSDHGDMMSSHGLLGKGQMFEESVRVPLLIRTPGQSQQNMVDDPTSQIDVVPTLLDLLGESQPEHLQGRSLKPILAQQQENPDRDVFIEWNSDKPGLDSLPEYAKGVVELEQASLSVQDEQRTVVTTDNWKFTWSRIGEHELYDLNSDPLEQNNLAGDPAQAGRIADLQKRIEAWQQRTGDTLQLPANK